MENRQNIHDVPLLRLLNKNASEGLKTDLSDVTFIVPLRIDSIERRENADTLIKYTFQHFDTHFIMLEADSTRRYFPLTYFDGFQYSFIKDNDAVFHRTKWINRLISMTNTQYLGIWDTDAIAPSEQITFAIGNLRSGKAVFSFPYDGSFYSCDKISSEIFKKFTEIEALNKRIPVMRLMHGYRSVGGAFMVNKKSYLQAGGENEGFYGWGPEDAERVKRLEILNLPVEHVDGPLFHLWHPLGNNSMFASPETERQCREIFLKTCSTDNKIV